MARKPAQTKADDKAKPTTATEAAKPADAGAAENTNPTGGEAIHGAAPASGDAPAADGPGQGGGGAGSEFPAAEDLQAATGTDAADDRHTEGGDKAGDIAAAPDHAPDVAVPGLGGEAGLDLPATNTAQEPDVDTGQALADAVASLGAGRAQAIPEGTSVEFVGLDLATSDVDWIVTCHREGGRRRAGRRWPKGETRVEIGQLSAYDLATLKGDPQFSVRKADRA